MSASTSGPAQVPAVGPLVRAVTTTVEPDAHVAAAAYLMKRAHDSALVVTTEPGRPEPLEIITDADISQAVADGRNLDDVRINQLGLVRVDPVDVGTPVAEAAERMLATHRQHLPVVDDGRLVGLVDMTAVCGALLATTRGDDGGGEAIRNVGG